MMSVDYATCPICHNDKSTGHYDNNFLWQIECDKCGHHHIWEDDETYEVEVTYSKGKTKTIEVPFSKDCVRFAVEGEHKETKEDIEQYLKSVSKNKIISWTATFMDEHDLD